MNSTEITEAEYFAEIDKLKTVGRFDVLTEIQFNCIAKARTGDVKVQWKALVKWWKEKGWGDVTVNSLQKRYLTAKEKRGIE